MYLQTVNRKYGSDLGNEYNIVFMGDFHVGNPTHNDTLLRKHLRELPSNSLVFLIGDLAEYIVWNDKRFEASSVDPAFWGDLDRLPQAYVDYLTDLLWPIKDMIVCVHDGNHEDKLSPNYQPGYELCKRLGVLSRYAGQNEAFTRIVFSHIAGGKTRMVMVNTHHGWQAGRQSGAKHNEMVRSLTWIGADVVIRGHSHELFLEPAPLLMEPSQRMTHMIYRNRFVGHSGSYFARSTVGSCSYSEKAQYPPLVNGHLLLQVSLGDSKIGGGTGRTISGGVVL